MTSRWRKLEHLLVSRTRLDQFAREENARVLSRELSGLALFPLSFSRCGRGCAVMAAQEGARRRLISLSSRRGSVFGEGGIAVAESKRGNVTIRVLDGDPQTVTDLARRLAWLRPRSNPGGPTLSTGDRLGLATPAHVRAIEGRGIFPYFAFQSPAENTATGRTWEDVLADARFGVLREGWRQGFGADADHLVDIDQVARAAKAGFVRFTLELSTAVESVASLDRKALSRKLVQLEQNHQEAGGWRRRYLGRSFETVAEFKKRTVLFDERTFLVTAVKMGTVVVRALELARQVARCRRGAPFEIEVSLFSTNEPTSVHEHLFLAMEMAEAGLTMVAFAPRFVGEFRRGVEYKGNPARFVRHLERHAAVARMCGGHALSLHSGSDKFSLYEHLPRVTQGQFGIKTSGTSFIEALRVVARHDRQLFSKVVDLTLRALARGETGLDFHIDPSGLPSPATLDEQALEEHYFGTAPGRHLLNEVHGVLLGQERGCWRGIHALVQEKEEQHFEEVATHLGRHIDALDLASASV